MLSLNKLSIYTIAFLLIVDHFMQAEFHSLLIYISILFIIIINKSFYTDKFQLTLMGLMSSIVFILLINFFFDYRVVTYNISTTDLIRDLWYFSRPVFILIIGYNLGKKSQPDHLIKVIIILGVFYATLHYLQLFQFGNNDIFAGRKSGELSGSSFLEALSFTILLWRILNRGKENLGFSFLKKWSSIILLAYIIPSIVLYFSRTMFVVILSTLFFMFELYKVNAKSIAISSSVILLIISLFIVQTSENNLVNKIQGSVTELGIGDEFDNRIQENKMGSVWRGYEAFRAVNQLFNNNVFVWFWGEGLGSKVDLKYYQKLGDREFRFIPQLHNGFVMVLFKSGIVGLLLYLFLMYKFTFGVNERSFLPIRNRKNLVHLAQGIGLSIFMASIVISGVYHKGDIGKILLLYGAILGSLTYQGPYVIGLLKIEQ